MSTSAVATDNSVCVCNNFQGKRPYSRISAVPPPCRRTNGSFVMRTIKLYARLRSKRINGLLPTVGLIDGPFRHEFPRVLNPFVKMGTLVNHHFPVLDPLLPPPISLSFTVPPESTKIISPWPPPA